MRIIVPLKVRAEGAVLPVAADGNKIGLSAKNGATWSGNLLASSASPAAVEPPVLRAYTRHKPSVGSLPMPEVPTYTKPLLGCMAASPEEGVVKKAFAGSKK
jgi:hypothetical protein